MPLRLPSPAARWLVFWLVCAALLVARAGSRRESRGVIVDHLELGRRLVHGEDVRGPWRSDPDAPLKTLHAPYPPSFGLLVAPFALVAQAAGQLTARLAWALMQVGCLVAIAFALRRAMAPPEDRADASVRDGAWQWTWLVTFLLGLRFVLRDMHGGGGNLVNLALCLAAFDAAERDRPARAGLLLGFSLATKPTQIWLVPVFLLLGHGRAVAWTVATGAAAVLVTLALQRFDASTWFEWIEGTWRFSTQADAFAVPACEFPAFEWMNQSLRCALARWLGNVPPEYAVLVKAGMPSGAGFDVATVAAITRAASALALSALAVVAFRSRRSRSARPYVFASALVLSVLLSPLSWKAHHVALLPVLFLLVRRLRGDLVARVLTAAWAICVLPGGDLVGDTAGEWLNSIYVVTAWDVVLFGWTLQRARSAALEDRDAALADRPIEALR